MHRDRLPVNVIDTCVFVEALSSGHSDARYACERYLWRIGQTFRPAITAPLVFELVALAREKPKEAQRILDVLSELTRNPDAVPIHPHRSTFERLARIQERDARIETLDAFHVASALGAGVGIFVTIDPVLLRTQSLKAEPVLILHPRALLGHQPQPP